MAGDKPKPPRAETIDRLSVAVYPAYAMMAGMDLDLFTPLGDGPKSADEIAAAIGVGARRLTPLLYALVSAGLLTEQDGRFANTAEADYYLVKGKPAYRGSAHEHFMDLWGAATNSAASIRADAPQAKHDFSKMSAEALTAFYRGGAAVAAATARALDRRFDFSKIRSMADIGGGSGGLAAAMCKLQPELRATVVELPSVAPITESFIAEQEAADRVAVLGIDATKSPIGGPYDMAVMRSLLQIMSVADAKSALANTAAALAPGGRLYIVGVILDDSHIEPKEIVGMHLVFLNVYDDGAAYTESEYREWLGGAGFRDIECGVLAGGVSLMTATKA